MKILDKNLGAGAHKIAYSIKDYPKQVALVTNHNWVTDQEQFVKLKGEHKALSVLRKHGIPAITARLQRVFNPHSGREVWAMIVPKMEGSLRDVRAKMAFEGWKSYRDIYVRLAQTGIVVSDLQFLATTKKVLISDPLSVTIPTDDWTKEDNKRYHAYSVRAIEESIASKFPEKKLKAAVL